MGMCIQNEPRQIALDTDLQKKIEDQDHRNRLAAIRLRLKSVNPGPWVAVRGSDFQGENWLICDAGIFERDGEDGTALVTTQGVHASRLCADSLADAEFIAASRLDVPWLLSALEATEVRAAEAERQRDFLASTDGCPPGDCWDGASPYVTFTPQGSPVRDCKRCRLDWAAQKDGAA